MTQVQMSRYERKYLSADSSFIVNEDDIDLRPIRISLPKAPPIRLIDGYGLHPEDQRFKRMEIPRKLLQIEEDAKLLEREASEKRSNYTITRYTLQRRFWDLIYEKREDIAPEIMWLKKLWWHKINGYWFFNHGKPTYISGWHFDYLHFWYIPEVRPDGHVHYRDRDRRGFLFHKYAHETTETFTHVDKNGWALPDPEGGYKMKDMGRRLCYGLGQPKNRRGGNTNQGLSILYSVTTTTIGTDGGGIMSYTGENAEKHFTGKLLESANRMPLFIQPFSTSTFAATKLMRFRVLPNEFDYTGLNNEITYAETSSSTFYDGKKLIVGFLDEEGKCLVYNTLVRMYDGAIKAIQDVIVGDQLMGDDNKPRNVTSLGTGRGKCYMIHPKKGEPWGCNSEHILSLYSCYHPKTKIGAGHIDISLKDYLGMTPNQKKHMMLYRRGVDYKENKHEIPPYVLGIWLGDGHTSGFTITSCDKEIIEEIYQYANTYNLDVRRDGIMYHLHGENNKPVIEYSRGERIAEFNGIIEAAKQYNTTPSYIKWHNYNRYPGHYFLIREPTTANSLLRKINVLEDKHIPKDYLIDSEQNRLELLAGIIDTDGYAFTGNKMGYEITQKKEKLAKDIVELARSLGFYAKMVPKKATMRRENGSLYTSIVSRVTIYGNDLWRVPCRVVRKKYIKRKLHKNTRNPMVSGFRVEMIGEQDYYGVVIDGNHRFLLEDYTVVHNTVGTDVDLRWMTIKNTLSQGDGAIIHGYSYHPSTAEEYTAGGAAYRSMMTKSSFYQRKPNGQTQSGLFRLYIRSDEGLDGFIDSYGMSVRNRILPHQRREGFKQTATDFINTDFEFLLKQDTPESLSEYRKKRKQFPMCWRDVWVGESGEIGFPTELIIERINELRKKELTIPGNLEWTQGFGSKVVWREDKDGHWEMSQLFEDLANRRIRDIVWDPIEMREKETWAPLDPSKGTIGADPIKYKSKTEVKQSFTKSGVSDGGITVYWEYDEKLEGNKPRSEWTSDDLICTYRYRPKTDDEFCEDVLKTCIWYGYMVYPEMNLEIIEKNFRIWGYEGYLKYDIAPDGQMKSEPGTYIHGGNKQDGFSMTRTFLQYRCHKIKHLRFLEECRDISNIEDLRNYDMLASFMVALLGSRSHYAKLLQRVSEDSIDLSQLESFFGQHSY